MSDFGKRKRESNFSANEKQLLVSVISKYAHIIEDKKTDRTSMDAKNKAWKCVETEFNSSNAEGTYRKAERLKKFFINKKHDLRILKAEEAKLGYLDTDAFDNNEHEMDAEIIKKFYDNEKKVRKDNAEDKFFLNKTGCGKLPVRKIDGTEEVMLSIMNKKTIYGLTPHKFDSDNVRDSKIQANKNVEFVYLQDEANEKGQHSDESDMDDNEEDNNCENDIRHVDNPLNKSRNHYPDAGLKSKQLNASPGAVLRNKENLDSMPGCSTWHGNTQNKTWSVGAGFTADQLSTPLNSVLRSKENEKSHQSSKTPIRQNKSCSRRRPTGAVKVMSSSLFAEKYDLLLDRRLILSEKLIEDLEEERVFKRKERKLKLELLQLEIDEKRQKKKNDHTIYYM